MTASAGKVQVINPADLGAPKGFSHGILAPRGRTLYVAGQIGDDADGHLAEGFVEQFDRALGNVLTVVSAAGGRPQQVVRMTVYVTSRDAYLSNLERVGEAWRERMGKHFPAMALVEVSALVDARAQVEIEATAVIPEGTDD